MPPKDMQEQQAESLKQKGNEYFKKGYLGAAIDAYTEAIVLCPNVAVFWTNRALCYKKKNEWLCVQRDCLKALELDRNSVKARYMLGLAMLELSRYPEAIRELEKALELLRNDPRLVRGENLDEVWRALSSAKYRQWEGDAIARREKRLALREEMQQMLKDRLQRQISEIRGRGRAGVDEAELVREYNERLNTLENVFERAAVNDRPGEIPDYLCCKITMDIFKDPVITPSGITYERAVILDHLNSGKSFDPVTRAPLSPTQLIPNLALRESVQSFLDQHGWAYNANCFC